jgi:hypothetical protein
MLRIIVTVLLGENRSASRYASHNDWYGLIVMVYAADFGDLKP